MFWNPSCCRPSINSITHSWIALLSIDSTTTSDLEKATLTPAKNWSNSDQYNIATYKSFNKNGRIMVDMVESNDLKLYREYDYFGNLTLDELIITD